jgi:hypothetical protein
MCGTGWIVHHNVFWQGETPQAPLQIVGSHRCFAGDDTASRCFNNTVVDSCARGTRDRDTGLAAWYTTNTIYARGDTAPWMFSNPVQRDYTLRAGSPAVDKGKIVPGWETTFSGSAPDLGAYEYGQPRWTAGADWQETVWSYPPSDLSVLLPDRKGAVAAGRMPAVTLMRGRMAFHGLQGTGYRAAMYNMQGAIVALVNCPEGGIHSLSTHGLATGMYALKVVCSNQTMVRNFAIGPMRE